MRTFVKLTEDQIKRYRDLSHEIVGDNYSEGYAEGELDGATYEMRGEWYQTCCISFYCPGQNELRGEVVFTEDGSEHHVDFDEDGYTYRYSYLVESSVS